MNRVVLLNEGNEEFKHEKILFPSKEDISRLDVRLEDSYNLLLLLEYEFGCSDTNAHFTKLAYLKDNQLFLFYDYDNPEHHSFYRDICNDNNFYQNSNSDIINFFIEARHLQYNLKFISTTSIKRPKI